MMRWFSFFSLFLILSRCGSPGAADSPVAYTLPDSITFREHIAPIVFAHCTPCHSAGGAGPFPLSSYHDLLQRTLTLRYVLADGIMPPWPADTTYSRFRDEKVITGYERALMLAWLQKGAPEGSTDIPLPALKTWDALPFGTPDLVLHFSDTIQIPGDNRDRFKLVKIPFELPADTFAKAIYFAPGNRQAVHHVNGHLINYPPGSKADVQAGSWIEDAEKLSSSIAYRLMDIATDAGTYPPLLASAFNYLPGVEPLVYPEGLGGVKLSQRGAFLLNTLHYGPLGRDTSDYSSIWVYFADKAPERPIRELHMGTLGVSAVVPEFVIPADSVPHFTTRYRLPESISVLTVNPHMHLLGQKIKAYAISPSGSDTIHLVRINRWDFRWQYFYTFQKMIKLPEGYEVIVEATFDNTSANPHNPYFPPRTIRPGGDHMKTTDEMFQFFITYLPYRPGDEHIRL